jgi:hypothetical protein
MRSPGQVVVRQVKPSTEVLSSTSKQSSFAQAPSESTRSIHSPSLTRWCAQLLTANGRPIMYVHTVSQSSSMMPDVTHRTCAGLCINITSCMVLCQCKRVAMLRWRPVTRDVPAGWVRQGTHTPTCISLNVNRLCKHDPGSQKGVSC